MLTQLTPKSAKPILTLEPAPILIDVEATQTETTSPTISTKELKDALIESASPTMSNMPTPYPTNKPILTLEPTPDSQPNLHADQTKTTSPTMSSQEINDALIETSSPTISNQPTPNPNILWNSGGWTLPNPTVSPVSYSLSRHRGGSSVSHPYLPFLSQCNVFITDWEPN